MNKIIKKLLSLICVICILSGMFVFISSAAGSSTMYCGTVFNIGDTVIVTVNVKADVTDKEIFGIEGNLSYNSSVLTFVDCDGTSGVSSSGIKFTVLGEEKESQSIKFTFTATAVGSSWTQLNGCTYSGGKDNSQYDISGCGVTINVKDPNTASSTPTVSSEALSSNANLSSLKISGITLSPKFSASRRSYTATADYSIDKCTITATAQDAAAKVEGTGTFDLAVGDNNRTVTVTAANGVTRKYTVKITRLAEGAGETSSLETEPEAPIESDPLNVEINGTEYRLVTDIAALYIPVGFSVTPAEYNGQQVNVLTETAGEYKLYYLTNIGAAVTELFYYDKNEELSKLSYIEKNGKFYIFEQPEGNFAAPEGYKETVLKTVNGETKAYTPDNVMLSDFYYVYCYSGGERGYYCYDSVEQTLQRAPIFKPVKVVEIDAEPADDMNLLDRFVAMPSQGKIVVIVSALFLLVFIGFVVLLIVRFSMKAENVKPPELSAEKNDVFDEADIQNGFEFSGDDKKEN